MPSNVSQKSHDIRNDLPLRHRAAPRNGVIVQFEEDPNDVAGAVRRHYETSPDFARSRAPRARGRSGAGSLHSSVKDAMDSASPYQPAYGQTNGFSRHARSPRARTARWRKSPRSRRRLPSRTTSWTGNRPLPDIGDLPSRQLDLRRPPLCPKPVKSNVNAVIPCSARRRRGASHLLLHGKPRSSDTAAGWGVTRWSTLR